MKKTIFIISFICSLSAHAGLPPLSNIPEQDNPIKVTTPFNKGFWEVQGVKFKEQTNEWEDIRKIAEEMGSGIPFKHDHHAFVCYQNNSQYLYAYDSGWGPGYALVRKPFSDIRECAVTSKPFKLGSGLSLGMSRTEVEKLLKIKTSNKVTELRYEKIYTQKVPPNKLCPIWNLITLTITFEQNKVSGVYFDDHGEPNDKCKTIDPLIIGVLDENQCKNKTLAVRPLFLKVENSWKSLDTEDISKKYDLNLNNIKWVIAFDGKNRGSITSIESHQIYDNSTYSRDYRQPFYSSKKINFILNKKNNFAGWCNSPKYRPLVLVSKQNYKDPDKWKPLKPKDSLSERLFPEFIKSLSERNICTVMNGAITNKPLIPKVDNIEFYKSYKSNKGSMLVQFNLKNGYGFCDSELGLQEGDSWYYVSKSKVKFLGNNMELVDAGDYDSDGASEIIYWHSGYNQDGYILFGPSLNKKASFIWSYH